MAEITKRRAKACVTHHNACDCREYKFQEMERALKILHTWGMVDKEDEWTSNPALKPEHVVELCEKALNCLN